MVDTSYLGVPKDPARNLGSSFECRDSSWPRGVSWHREFALRRAQPAHKTVRSIDEPSSPAIDYGPADPAAQAHHLGRAVVLAATYALSRYARRARRRPSRFSTRDRKRVV